MNNNLTFFKSFLFGLAILSSSFLISMEESLTLKGYINLSDEPSALSIGSILNPELMIALQPKEGKLINHTLNYKDGKWESITTHSRDRSRIGRPTGKHKNFIIVQTGPHPLHFEEIPVS